MGHEVEKTALHRGHSILAQFDTTRDWERLSALPGKPDAVIDFSTPESAPDVADLCFSHRIVLISGTTGWPEKLAAAIEKSRQLKVPFFYAPNFSPGMNIFFELNRRLAKLMKIQADSRAEIQEIHHIHKLDAPSGTAIALASQIIDENPRYNQWSKGEAASGDILPVFSIRQGEVPGTHIVKWQGKDDTIEMHHMAHNRSGFAFGAVLAAEWMQGRNGFFQMKDLMADMV
jgi:4-hydroxy-tetrahydrodipicolinate reductase